MKQTKKVNPWRFLGTVCVILMIWLFLTMYRWIPFILNITLFEHFLCFMGLTFLGLVCLVNSPGRMSKTVYAVDKDGDLSSAEIDAAMGIGYSGNISIHDLEKKPDGDIKYKKMYERSLDDGVNYDDTPTID